MCCCRLLQIPQCVLLLERYITSRFRPEFGAVCGAFANAVRLLLADWGYYVCTLEKELMRSEEWTLIRVKTYSLSRIGPLIATASAFCAVSCDVQRIIFVDLILDGASAVFHTHRWQNLCAHASLACTLVHAALVLSHGCQHLLAVSLHISFRFCFTPMARREKFLVFPTPVVP